MIIKAYILIVLSLIFVLWLKANKTLQILGISIITIVTLLLIIVSRFEQMVIPSIHKSEFSSIAESTSLTNFFDDAKLLGSEREFHGFFFKVKQGEILCFNKTCEDGSSSETNKFYYQIYNFENEEKAQLFMPKILFQENNNFRMASFLTDVADLEYSDEDSSYFTKAPEWSIRKYKIDDEITIYYIPSVVSFDNIGWFLITGYPCVWFDIDSVCAIQKEGCVFVLYENTDKGSKTEIIKAIKQYSKITTSSE